jgi:hypothetical protein
MVDCFLWSLRGIERQNITEYHRTSYKIPSNIIENHSENPIISFSENRQVKTPSVGDMPTHTADIWVAYIYIYPSIYVFNYVYLYKPYNHIIYNIYHSISIKNDELYIPHVHPRASKASHVHQKKLGSGTPISLSEGVDQSIGFLPRSTE